MNIFKNTCLASFTVFLLLTYHLTAQMESQMSCGTTANSESIEFYRSINSDLKQFEEEFLSLASNKHKSGIKIVNSIPIKAHVLRYSDGSEGISSSDIYEAIENLNVIFSEAYLEFFICDGINYIDDDELVHVKKGKDDTLKENYNVSGLINIYFSHNIKNSSDENICGYSNNTFRNDVIFVNNYCARNKSSLAHEMGHFFSLIHTHGPNNERMTSELVDGSNCDTDGDGICDTPADPGLSKENVDNCNYIGTYSDANGDSFTPDVSNIMSYAPKACRTHFSKQQLARMYGFYRSVKNYLSCPSFNADFSADVNQTCESELTVNFTTKCSGISSWEWDVDSDGIIDYTTASPTHTYTSGVHDVTLTVSNKSKTISRTYSNFVKVGTDSKILDEDFNSFEIAGDQGWTAIDASQSGYNWYINSGKTDSEGTGPHDDHTSGEALGKYIYAEASGAKPGDVAEFISPCININYYNSELEFAYHMFGNHVGELHVDIKTQDGYINDVIPPILGSQQDNHEDPFLIENVDLSQYTHQTINIRFRAIRGASWDGDIAIDDIFIKTIHVPISDEVYKVYPNPMRGNMLFVKIEDELNMDMLEPVRFTISNLVGQEFLSGVLSEQPIDTGKLSSGTYLLTLYNGKNTVIKKIIK